MKYKIIGNCVGLELIVLVRETFLGGEKRERKYKIRILL